MSEGPSRVDNALRRESTPGRRGYAALRRELDAVRDRLWSRLECAAHVLLRGAGITGWVANRAIYARRDEKVAYGDLVFADLRLVIELDGKGYHSADGHARRDEASDLRLARLG